MRKTLSNIRLTVLGIIVAMLVALVPTNTLAAPNWKSLYQSKVKQIESEYKQKKRKTDDYYEHKAYTLADMDFDGVPELYHCLAGKSKAGYEVKPGSEEIYYIKNNKVLKGKIQGSENCGMLPAYDAKGNLTDGAWQYAMYNSANGSPVLVTSSIAETEFGFKEINFNEVSFDCDSGVLTVTRLLSQEYTTYPPVFEEYFSYEVIGNASTSSVGSSVNADLWKWEACFVKESEDSKESATVAPAVSWSDEYKNFLINKKFSDGSRRYYSEIDIEFFMNDMNADGIPELAIQNGTKDNSKAQVHFYTFLDKKITYIGSADGYSEIFKYMNSTAYPGVFSSVAVGGGTQNGYYYTLSGQELSIEHIYTREVVYENGAFDQTMIRVTNDDALYRACQATSASIKLSALKVASGGNWNNLVNEAIKKYVSMYSDVPSNNWCYDAVKYVSDRNLMSGISRDLFDPNGKITRAQFITVLYRLDGMPKTKAASYKDVPKGSWYEAAVSWATAKGIASGVSKTQFAPDQIINREQLTTILQRYAKYKKKTVTADEDILLGYVDNTTVSSYARASVAWAIENGIISGTDAIHVSPFAEATRAQVAVILQRFCEKYKL